MDFADVAEARELAKDREQEELIDELFRCEDCQAQASRKKRSFSTINGRQSGLIHVQFGF